MRISGVKELSIKPRRHVVQILTVNRIGSLLRLAHYTYQRRSYMASELE